MADEKEVKLEQYINSQTNKGFSLKQIRKKLIASKYKEEIVDKVIGKFEGVEPEKKPLNLKIPAILLLLIVIIAALVVITPKILKEKALGEDELEAPEELYVDVTYNLTREQVEAKLEDCISRFHPERNLCLAMVKQDDSYCVNPDNISQQQVCLAEFRALITRNVDECSTTNFPGICRVVLSGDIDSCAALGQDSLIKMCSYLINPSEENKNLLPEGETKDNAISNRAIINNELSRCDEISDEDIRDRCRAYLSGGTAYCDLKNPYVYDCYQAYYSEVAFTEKDISKCELVDDISLREGCLVIFAEGGMASESFCEGFTLSEFKERCLAAI